MRRPWIGSCFHHDIHFNDDWPPDNEAEGIPAPKAKRHTQRDRPIGLGFLLILSPHLHQSSRGHLID
jgi:hypothetical protein